jgi:hypothetical protein
MFPSPDAPAAAPAAGAPVAEGGNKKALLALGGIGAALVVGAGAFFLLNSGGSTEPLPVAVPQASAPAAAPSAAPSTAASAKPVARPAAASVTGRDPFKPLFPAVSTGEGVVVAPAGGSSGGGSSSSGGSGAAPVPAPAPAAPTVTLSVSKVDMAGQSATVAVDGKKYATSVNVPFGKYYTVYAIFNDSCVGVLYGDQSVAVCTSKPMTVSP